MGFALKHWGHGAELWWEKFLAANSCWSSELGRDFVTSLASGWVGTKLRGWGGRSQSLAHTGPFLLPFKKKFNPCKILKLWAESEKRKGSSPSTPPPKEQHTQEINSDGINGIGEQVSKNPMGRGNREGSVGKLLTKRGPGRFTRFLFDNIRKREKERERKSARWKSYPRVPRRTSYLAGVQLDALDRKATIRSKQAPGPHCGCSRLAHAGLAGCRVQELGLGAGLKHCPRRSPHLLALGQHPNR